MPGPLPILSAIPPLLFNHKTWFYVSSSRTGLWYLTEYLFKMDSIYSAILWDDMWNYKAQLALELGF